MQEVCCALGVLERSLPTIAGAQCWAEDSRDQQRLFCTCQGCWDADSSIYTSDYRLFPVFHYNLWASLLMIQFYYILYSWWKVNARLSILVLALTHYSGGSVIEMTESKHLLKLTFQTSHHANVTTSATIQSCCRFSKEKVISRVYIISIRICWPLK